MQTLMNARVQIKLNVLSVGEAQQFYCHDLGLFDVHYDYGMGNLSLVFKHNPAVFLILTAGKPFESQNYTFALEANNCERLFKQLLEKPFVTAGRVLSEEVFEYPLGKNFVLQDPSGYKVLIFEEEI